jgi:hypothetical protein
MYEVATAVVQRWADARLDTLLALHTEDAGIRPQVPYAVMDTPDQTPVFWTNYGCYEAPHLEVTVFDLVYDDAVQKAEAVRAALDTPPLVVAAGIPGRIVVFRKGKMTKFREDQFTKVLLEFDGIVTT